METGLVYFKMMGSINVLLLNTYKYPMPRFLAQVSHEPKALSFNFILP